MTGLAVPSQTRPGREISVTARARLRAYIDSLPAVRVMALYDQIQAGLVADRSLGAAKDIFVASLNGSRPQRARRLFYEFFSPVLAEDRVLASARRPLPALIHRKAVSGVWRALLRQGLDRDADRVQGRLDDLATGMILRDAFLHPEADRLRVDLRERCHELLGRVLAAPGAAAAFLRALETGTDKEEPRCRRLAETARRWDPVLPGLVHDVLLRADRLAPAFARAGQLAASPGSDVRIGRDLAGLALDLEKSAGPGAEPLLPALPVLTVLYRWHRPLAVAYALRDLGASHPAAPVLGAALIGYAAAHAEALAGLCTRVLAIGRRLPGASIRIPTQERREFDHLMARLSPSMAALTVSGLADDPRSEPEARILRISLETLFARSLADIAMQRTILAMTVRSAPLVDHEDLLWLLRALWSWRKVAARNGLDASALETWRRDILGDLCRAIPQAARFEPGDTSLDRIDHFVRLEEIAAALDGDVYSRLPVSSRNIVAMLSDLLKSRVPLTEGRRRMAATFLEAARSEARKVRFWCSPELADVIELGERRNL
ncbi:MAG: hypothetical protein WCJ64_19110 [Rhodospirillaceae bacterium]